MHFATRNRERTYSKFVLIMTRLSAILNVINSKGCGAFQARGCMVWYGGMVKLYLNTRASINVSCFS